ncbi:glycosyltransferase family 9 protein [Aliarcobacter skirrowii]|uniref:Heptosyltransferase n=1 Tax=Aliarcobacter skirrowii CCUG 10374 TaxID=1032239 RepID=A0AAD0SM02_9BACT|nr:glycosyltransferase family 9 protein [Aliarcobacter skirrowii]AXX85251.1 heptosyltransferase [Aliarcobacter skirrowii CCUG 10374]KAB0620043.1 glycosyltransferase family 9 protein [Aliarcobacter skirrowii CCUG 10374]RXI24791.1 heptosyltransferase [Aliarcobacter skirrowii CCUG 10374]SUU96217.1 lipopolysaccharide core biosynthesis protein [Aliarcobacter skirrowii]
MNLLITRHDKIGDFLVSLPLFKAIKEQYPSTKLTALVSKINFDFAKSLDFIDDVILYDKSDLNKTLQDIKSKKFDVSISCFIDTSLAILLFKSRIKKRVAPATKIAQIFFNIRVKQRRSKVEKTEWQYNLDLAKAIFPDIKLDFKRPLLNLDVKKDKRVIFHAGFGGSSDGNLSLDDYLSLARSIKDSEYEVVFSFGPDDEKSKEYIESKLDFKATIYNSKGTLLEFTKYIASSTLFVSTSTGPMHLAGATNSKTLSFFGDSLFASSKRWATISDEKYQNNFMLNKNYSKDDYIKIENCLKEILDVK